MYSSSLADAQLTAKASFPITAYCFSASDKEHEMKQTGHQEPSSCFWRRTAPIPSFDAYAAKMVSFAGS